MRARRRLHSRLAEVGTFRTTPAHSCCSQSMPAKSKAPTESRALVGGEERGVHAEVEAKQNLKAACRDFVDEAEPERKNEAGRDLIRATFGKDSIARD